MSTFLISGASGFIGSRLSNSLAVDGHRVVALSRRYLADSVRWSPEAGVIDRDALARVKPDIVINLAGEPIAHRWTPARRRHIRDSRVHGTAVLAEALAALRPRPMVLLSGSAIGYYGAHHGDELLDEESTPGADFLAQTARDWERATQAASDAGIRVVLSRTGNVLGRHGGALAPMLWPFRLGIGGRIGSGRQWMSWILLDDIVRAMRFVIESSLSGPVNLVSPEPVQNADFASTLGRVLDRPAALPVPAFALHLVFGSMADDTILASQRVLPARLMGSGFQYQFPRLEEALRAELTRSGDQVNPGGRLR